MPNQFVITLLIIAIISSFFAIIHSSIPTNAFKLITLLAFMSSSIFVSSREKKIPNIMIISAVALRIIIAIIDIIAFNQYCPEIITRDILGAVLGSGIIILINKFSKNLFSIDEIKLFTIMGMFSGYICTYSSLMIALSISFIIKTYMFYKEKKNIKLSLEPFLLCGYVISMMIYKG